MFDTVQCLYHYSHYVEIQNYDFHIDVTFEDTDMKQLRLPHNRKENFVKKAIKVTIEFH